MKESILAVLMSFRAFFGDTETPEERRARMTIVAEAIEAAAYRATCFGKYATEDCRPLWHGTRSSLAAALIVLGHAESNFAQYVHENRCLEGPRGMRCDLDNKGVPRARGLWQVWRVACPDLWDQMTDASPESTNQAAWCTTIRITSAFRRCKSRNQDPWAGAFSGYRGASCTWPGATTRAQKLRRVQARL